MAETAATLVAGDLEAVVWPARGMLVASLRHRGDELLRRIEDLEAAAAKGSSAGIPLLHPWANRLAASSYRAAGREVTLDSGSPLLHLDGRGLPMHGVPWSRLAWDVTERSRNRLAARLEWSRPELLAIFPFPHRLDLVAAIDSDALTLSTTLTAGVASAVPVSFGFHPYLGLSNPARAEWRLVLPAMQRLLLDANGIPTGQEEPFAAFDAALGARAFDDGFRLLAERPVFALLGGGRRIAVEFLEGFSHAQVFAPSGEAYVALEPMTAPTNALASGRSLRILEPTHSFRATFRVTVGQVPA